jgi:hypothetical protein
MRREREMVRRLLSSEEGMPSESAGRYSGLRIGTHLKVLNAEQLTLRHIAANRAITLAKNGQPLVCEEGFETRLDYDRSGRGPETQENGVVQFTRSIRQQGDCSTTGYTVSKRY